MNKNNKALFVFGFIFYFIGDLATTYIALSNGMPESGLVRINTRDAFSIMVLVKVIFFTALYFLIVFLEKQSNNYLCGAILGLVAGMGMTVTWMNALAILEYLG
jgi:polyferredoxin